MASSLSLLIVWFLLFVGEMVSISNVQGEEILEVMEEKELKGLFEVMDALLDDPDWAQAHPQPCTDTPWPGVECEVSSDYHSPTFHVTKIHIGPDILSPPCKPSAYLSKSLLKLTYLKTLSIFNCFVASKVTLQTILFGPFSSLEHLALQSNPTLDGEIPPSLGGVTNLRVLSLSQNSFKGSIPREIGGLACLEQLDLSYNNLSGEVPKEIGGLKSLTILDLSWNEIEGNLPYSIGQLQLLQKMDLSSNKLKGKMPSEMGNLKRLVLLDLSHNFLGGPIPETLSSLELLEYLIIDDNPIKSWIPHFIGKLWKLKTVSFSRCGLVGSIPSSLFSSLNNLLALSLDNNSLSGKVPPNLGLLPSLDQLNISHNLLNGVLHFPYDFIGKLGKRLDVRGNNELCISTDEKNKNLTSYLEIPSCVGMRAVNDESSSEGAPEDPAAGIRPSRIKSNISSSSAWLNLKVVIFTLVSSFINFSFLNLFL